jgi:hypothetical protein
MSEHDQWARGIYTLLIYSFIRIVLALKSIRKNGINIYHNLC